MLDGKRVEVARLKAGQTILLASVSLKVIETQPAQDAPATIPKSTAKALPEDPPIEAPPKGAKSLVLDIPGYSIQETLGKGGMGEVFRARHNNATIAERVLYFVCALGLENYQMFQANNQMRAGLLARKKSRAAAAQ